MLVQANQDASGRPTFGPGVSNDGPRDSNSMSKIAEDMSMEENSGRASTQKVAYKDAVMMRPKRSISK